VFRNSCYKHCAVLQGSVHSQSIFLTERNTDFTHPPSILRFISYRPTTVNNVTTTRPVCQNLNFLLHYQLNAWQHNDPRPMYQFTGTTTGIQQCCCRPTTRSSSIPFFHSDAIKIVVILYICISVLLVSELSVSYDEFLCSVLKNVELNGNISKRGSYLLTFDNFSIKQRVNCRFLSQCPEWNSYEESS